jgi:hypothetical protein
MLAVATVRKSAVAAIWPAWEIAPEPAAGEFVTTSSPAAAIAQAQGALEREIQFLPVEVIDLAPAEAEH